MGSLTDFNFGNCCTFYQLYTSSLLRVYDNDAHILRCGRVLLWICNTLHKLLITWEIGRQHMDPCLKRSCVRTYKVFRVCFCEDCRNKHYYFIFFNGFIGS